MVGSVDPAQFFAASRLVIVAGKGGVGKTVVAAALARAAALSGLSTLVIDVDGRSSLSALFAREPLDYHEVELAAGGGPHDAADVRGRTLTSDEALLEYLRDHGLSRVSQRLVGTGALDVAATAAPGIRDILVLGKLKQLERSGFNDLIVLDAPSAGHAISFLLAARTLLDTVRVGPIQTQATDVLELLSDPERASVTLVTMPEETPVNEVVETAYLLEDRVGVALGPVVVNGLYPPAGTLDVDPEAAAAAVGATLAPGEADDLRAAASFRRQRGQLQQAQLERLADQLPLPQIHLPHLFAPVLGPDQIDQLAGHLLASLRSLQALR
jgi:anion-transporting  ArsA/GET3 family ATPase